MDLREYEDLATLLTYETDTKYPLTAAVNLLDNILGYAPDLEYLVLFVGPDPEHPWLLIPCPGTALESLEAAKRSIITDGRYPVAFWKRKFPTESSVDPQTTPPPQEPGR